MAKRYGIRIQRQAKHYHGHAWCYDEKKDNLKEEELLRLLNDEDDLSGTGYKVGEQTNRFPTWQLVIDIGVSYLCNKHGEETPIEVGPHFYPNNPMVDQDKGMEQKVKEEIIAMFRRFGPSFEVTIYRNVEEDFFYGAFMSLFKQLVEEGVIVWNKEDRLYHLKEELEKGC